jgi:GNAT superfamily N-acetyltransferase
MGCSQPSYPRAVEALRPDSPVDELRLATLDDVPAIIDLYRGLSPESQRMRFSTCVSEDVLLRAAFLGESFDAVIALSGGRVIGEARLETNPESDHEFAVTVADDAQGRGVGTALLDGLRERARDRGIVTLRAQVRIDNVPMLTLLRRVGGVIVLVSGGDVLMDIASDRQMPGWPSRGTATKVLVEAAGLVERPITTALRSAGYDVRQCGGPGSGRRDPCPLLSHGQCRLAAEADAIVCLLPDSDAQNRAVAAAHVTARSDRLAAGLAVSVR